MGQSAQQEKLSCYSNSSGNNLQDNQLSVEKKRRLQVRLGSLAKEDIIKNKLLVDKPDRVRLPWELKYETQIEEATRCLERDGQISSAELSLEWHFKSQKSTKKCNSNVPRYCH